MVRVDKIMMKRIIVISLILVLLGTPLVVLASDISNADYYGIIVISNNSTATTNVATTCNISTTNLIAGDYLNASATNCVIRTSSGADVAFMPGYTPDNYPWSIWVPSIGANSYQSDLLYTANSTGGLIKYFPNLEGMAVIDNASLELADNFTVEVQGFTDTALTGSANRSFLDYVRANSDWTSIPDHNNFSFTDGGGNDKPFSIILWANMDNMTDSTFANKGTAAGNKFEWKFGFAATSQVLYMTMWIADGTAKIGRGTADLSAYEGDWIHFAATYDGSETVGGVDLYVNGMVADIVNLSTPVYTGMTNSDRVVEFGSKEGGAGAYMEGKLAGVKIFYDNELTAAEIRNDYNGIYTTTGLEGWWEIDEGVGNPTDSSGNSHDATANLADWVTGSFYVPEYLVRKSLAYETRYNAPGEITSSIIGGVSVTATGIASGEHKVTTSANTTHLWIDIDDVTKDSIALAGSTVTNNANDWAFLLYDAMPYCDNITVEINGILRGSWDWEYGTAFTDDSGNGNTATPTFRSASSDLDVTAELISFLPIAEAQAPDYTLLDPPPFIDSDITGNVTSPFTTTPPAGTFPLAGVIRAVANATSTPAQLPLLIIALFTILALSLAVSATMRKHGSGSIFVKILVIVAIMGVFIGLKDFAIDFWMLVVFLIISISFAMGSRHIGWS